MCRKKRSVLNSVVSSVTVHSGILPQSLCVCSGVFPEPDVDPVIQIASMVQRQGEKEPFIRTVFTLQSCASIVGSQILCFTQEKQLLQVHHHILCRDTHTHTCSVNRLASHGLGALSLACLLSLSLFLSELGGVCADGGSRHHYRLQHSKLRPAVPDQQSRRFKGAIPRRLCLCTVLSTLQSLGKLAKNFNVCVCPCVGQLLPLSGADEGHQIGPERLQLPEQADGPQGKQNRQHGGQSPV